MKKFFCLLFALLFLISSLYSGKSLAEEKPEALSFDFNLGFHMNPDAFSVQNAARMKGYADLLEILNLQGNVTLATGGKSMDLDLTVIPKTNPSAAISMKFFGLPSHMVMTSPLLGEETIMFNNAALMEFSQKTYTHLGLPLPYLALCYPYSTENAFSSVVKAWKSKLGDITETTDIPASSFSTLARSLNKILEENVELKDWFDALSLESDHSETLEAELNSVPMYLRNHLAEKKSVHVSVKGPNEVTWGNSSGIFYHWISSDLYEEITADLPLTENGFHPVLRWHREEKENSLSLRLLLDYSKAEEAPEKETLLRLDFSALLPSDWPVPGAWFGEAEIAGELLPNLHLRAEMDADAEGQIEILVYSVAEGSSPEQPLLTIYGSVNAVEPASVPHYSAAWTLQFTNIFSVNDVTLKELMGKVLRPAVKGLVAFLVEVPASSCQSIMDDLTEYGVLSVLLGD